jgi:DNA-binding GntR family transcriptional regulator
MPAEASAEMQPVEEKPRLGGRPVPLHKVHRPSLTDIAVEQVRHMIVHGHVRPGERLSEPAICDALGISRTPVREALKLLAAEGLVELRRNRNPVVSHIDPIELAHLFEVEGGIEGMAARLAASRMTNADLNRLETLQARLERHHARRELENYFDVNQQVHKLIVAAAKNPVLVRTHNRLLGRLERARLLALSAEGRWEQAVLEHREILAALKAGDGEKAAALCAAHVERTGAIVGELATGRALDTGQHSAIFGEDKASERVLIHPHRIGPPSRARRAPRGDPRLGQDGPDRG